MTQSTSIECRSFESRDAEAFRQLNEAWISKYFAIEDADRALLWDPEGYVLKKGGHIFMAFVNDRAVGTSCLLAAGPEAFELAKMAVSEELQGRGIGRKLMEHTIAEARRLGAKRLTLETNQVLKPAVALYESVGFRHIPPDRIQPSLYVRANVFMELAL